jgi:hypothetical protein
VIHEISLPNASDDELAEMDAFAVASCVGYWSRIGATYTFDDDRDAQHFEMRFEPAVNRARAAKAYQGG